MNNKEEIKILEEMKKNKQILDYEIVDGGFIITPVKTCKRINLDKVDLNFIEGKITNIF
jgi:hypothetical protein